MLVILSSGLISSARTENAKDKRGKSKESLIFIQQLLCTVHKFDVTQKKTEEDARVPPLCTSS